METPNGAVLSKVGLGGPLCLDLTLKKMLTYLIRFFVNSFTAWLGQHLGAATQYPSLKCIATNYLGVSHIKKEEEGKQVGRRQR